MLDTLLDDLDVLTEYDKDKYQRLHFMEIEAVSKQGTLEGAALIDGQWIPKSQMRCDFDGNLFEIKQGQGVIDYVAGIKSFILANGISDHS